MQMSLEFANYSETGCPGQQMNAYKIKCSNCLEIVFVNELGKIFYGITHNTILFFSDKSVTVFMHSCVIMPCI